MPRLSMREEDDYIIVVGLLGAISGLITTGSLPDSGVAAIRNCLERGNAVDKNADVDELAVALGAVALRLEAAMC